MGEIPEVRLDLEFGEMLSEVEEKEKERLTELSTEDITKIVKILYTAYKSKKEYKENLNLYFFVGRRFVYFIVYPRIVKDIEDIYQVATIMEDLITRIERKVKKEGYMVYHCRAAKPFMKLLPLLLIISIDGLIIGKEIEKVEKLEFT